MGWAYLVVLVAGEGSEEDLRTCVGRQRQPPSRRQEEPRAGAGGAGLGLVGGEEERVRQARPPGSV